jgi:hypothetical protein
MYSGRNVAPASSHKDEAGLRWQWCVIVRQVIARALTAFGGNLLIRALFYQLAFIGFFE